MVGERGGVFGLEDVMLVIDNDVGARAFSLVIGIYLRELYALLLDGDILGLAKDEVSGEDWACEGGVVPAGVWHTVEVLEPSVIYEAKDGKYGEDGSEAV